MPDCPRCALVERAIALAPTVSAVCLRAPGTDMTPANDAARLVADASVRLSRALNRLGWRRHRHAENLWRTEPESEPVPDNLVPPAVRAHADAIAARLNATALDDQPLPKLPTDHPSITLDHNGHILLPLPSVIPPDALESTLTFSKDRDEAIRIWRKIVPELASGWAELPNERPLSLGLIFLGPKDRLIFWPRAINRLLGRIPVSYGTVEDLVRVAVLVGVKIDLQAAYRSLVIAELHRKYYGACVDGVFLQFGRAPFGARCSPAHFVIALAATLTRVTRAMAATEAALQALSAFVDDLGMGAGSDRTTPGKDPLDDPDALHDALARLYRLVDNLVSALVEDGWWIALSKCFLRPALRLFYTGVVANLPVGSLAIHPTKAAKLRELLAEVTFPASLLDPTSDDARRHPAVGVPPGLRAACRSLGPVPMAMALLPFDPTGWPTLPDAAVIDPAMTASVPTPSSSTQPPALLHDAASIPAAIPSVTVADTATALWSTVLQAAATLPTDPRRLGYHPRDTNRPAALVLIATASAQRAHAICTEMPPRDMWRSDVAVVVAYPRDPAAIVARRPWFDSAFALPADWPDRRPLPPVGSAPAEPLPGDDAPTLRPPQPRPGSADVTPQEFAALSAAQGYISWLSTVAPHVAGWRRSVDDAQWTGVWSAEAVAALRYAWDMAPWLPQWERRVRVTARRRVLHVSCDASTCSWAAIIRGDDGRVTLLAGSLPFAARAASTLTREAWGSVFAIRAAVDSGAVFDHVDVETDNDGTACTAGSGHSHAADAEAAMHALAAYEWQGVRIGFTWRRRSEGLQPIADAMSPAAGVEVWPLRSYVASYIWDNLPDGWHVDGLSAAERSFSPAYYTGEGVGVVRAAMFERLETGSAGNRDVGWQGDAASWRPAAGQVMFVHTTWCNMPRVAELAAAGVPMVAIIPEEARGEWWQPHWAAIVGRATAKRRLPARATRMPGRPHTGVSAQEVLGPSVDFRRLQAVFIGVQPRRVDTPGAVPPGRGRPQWWSPWRLSEDGDVEENPGPGGPGASLARPTGRPQTPSPPGASRNAPTGVTASAAPRPFALRGTATSDTRAAAAASIAGRPAVAPGPYPPPGGASIGRPTGREVSPVPPARRTAPPPIPRGHAPRPVEEPTRRAGARPPTAVAPAGSDRNPSAASLQSKRVGRTPLPAAAAAPGSSLSAARHRDDAARGFSPAAKARRTSAATGDVGQGAVGAVGSGPPATLGELARRAVAFAQGHDSAVAHADVPEALRAHVQQSATVARGASSAAGDRKDRVPRYMLTLVEHLGIQGAAPSVHAVQALMCAYIHHRLAKPPPFKWRECEAPAVMSDASSYAETLRISGLLPSVPKYCGTLPQRELEKRGGKDVPEHSQAFPLHLRVLLDTKVPRNARLRAARNFLLVMSFFGLRTGIVFMLAKEMFLPWFGGFLLIWRFATKRRGGDRTKAGEGKPLPTTNKVHFTAALDPWLVDFFKQAPAGPLFEEVTYDDINEFIHSFIPGVPEAFDIRTYGVRVAADTESVELGAPKGLIDRMFDWKPVQKRMSSHYSGSNILLMYKLTHERANNLEVVNIAPALYAIVYRGRSRPDWGLPIVPRSAPPLPRPDPAVVDAVWRAPAPTRRRNGRAPVASGAGAAAPSGRDPSPALSVDCADCDTHVSRRDVAAMCEVPSCGWGKCLECFPDLAKELWCPEHRPHGVAE